MSDVWLEKLSRHRTGLIVGGLIGLPWGGPVGALFGAAVGYWLDKQLRKSSGPGSHLEVQRAFFVATFTVMGRLAKADGRVTETEIAFAKSVMDRMRLNDAQRQEAIRFFNQGKEPQTDLHAVLEPLVFSMSRSFSLRQIFLEIQLQTAMIDGQITQGEVEVLDKVCSQLRIGVDEFQSLIRRMQAEQAFFQWHRQRGQQQQGYQEQFQQWGQQRSAAAGLQEAYGVLGVTAEASDQELKQAYRRLMSQHHPDKLVSKGLPDEMIQLAKEKTQEIQAAYERVKEARGLK
ncbi:hypothetical protein WH50_18035 [Pokkaliibacter plantistimulans]|uniref:Co-chaperone protein DjlA n=2 Tax=Pseudomonadota TaxID=1224 RepID=A0ABX5LUN9_9GAMM|nr:MULTISPECIES: co-chaperone DjlA [Pokkaliibacter]MDH2434282.1 co-chaperone DjlA [Pokkaliibacter sp. MBI-7]PPC74593.1 co-chaperone DjlA [Pokkaliibacter plantistimulans]PXF29942.1 hypothetical protein WH50_18035 [Pokkaliibacter plantistimulans]